jgi:G3E family GTPase
MLQTIMTDSSVCATHRIAAIVTLVDTVHGEATLQDHAEARNQVALADQLLVSKTDLRPPSDRLLARLTRLNPGAPCVTTAPADPAGLFGGASVMALSERLAGLPRQHGHREIETFTIIRDRALPAVALTMLLQAIAEHCGSRLLRLKGLVAIEEIPGRPAVIHGVRHVVSAPEFLDHWPGSDHRTRIVFIAKGIPRHFVSRLLDAIEDEVRDALGRIPGSFDPSGA